LNIHFDKYCICTPRGVHCRQPPSDYIRRPLAGVVIWYKTFYLATVGKVVCISYFLRKQAHIDQPFISAITL